MTNVAGQNSNEVCECVQKIIVKKATEFGEAEVWMNERLARAAPQTCAKFLTAYSDGPSTKPGTPLVLVWLYEGPMTLAAAMGDRFFPFNVERQLLGRELKISSPVERRLVSTKVRALARVSCDVM